MLSKLPATYAETQSIRRLIEPSVIANPYSLYASLSEQGSLYWDEEAKVWVCTGYEEAETILRDPQVRFRVRRLRSNEQLRERRLEKLIPLYTLLRPQMIFQDDPQHRQLRAAIQRRFTTAAVNGLQEAVQALVNEQLAPFVGNPQRGQMDLLDDFARVLPTKVAALFLGLPLSDLPRFMRWNAAYESATARFTGPIHLLDLPTDQVDDRCDFFEAGGDSLALVSLLLAIDQHLQVEIDPEIIYDYPVLSDLAELIVEQQQKARTTVPEREAVYS